jgi:hypothetical protein
VAGQIGTVMYEAFWNGSQSRGYNKDASQSENPNIEIRNEPKNMEMIETGNRLFVNAF